MSDLRANHIERDHIMRHEFAAIVCSDIHLSHRKPVFRDPEPDWYEAQRRPLDQIRWLQSHVFNDTIPVVIAGDLFDRWNSPPELIGFAMDTLPNWVLALPGQHDLPNHDYSNMQRSAYGVLVKAKRIQHFCMENGPYHIQNAMLYGFPWGFPITSRAGKSKRAEGVQIAVCHQFVYQDPKQAKWAPEESRAMAVKTRIDAEGYDLGVFGDNHQGFRAAGVFNCGGLMRRTLDQLDYKPRIGLITKTGASVTIYLDTSQDLNIEPGTIVTELVSHMDFSEMIQSIRELGSDGLKFVDIVNGLIRKSEVSEQVRRIVAEVITNDRRR